MSIEPDPEGYEIEALRELVALDDKQVLEIGCGDGRLTWRYADKPAHVIAIDPDEEAIAKARVERPLHLRDRIEFVVAAFEDFVPRHQFSTFDVGIFSWSLACIDPENMYAVLERARTMLKPTGVLVNIQEVPHTRTLEVHSADRTVGVGKLGDRVDFEDIKLAESALSISIDEGLFAIEDERVFEGRIYAGSLQELRDGFPGILIDDDQASRVTKIISQSGTATRVAFCASVRMTALTPGRSRV